MDTNQPPVDTMAPWTIKAFATEARREIVHAAEEQHITVGQYIEKLYREREGNQVSNRFSRPGVSDTGPLIDVMNAPGAPKWLRTGAARRLGGLLGIPVPETRPGPRRRVAGPGDAGTGEG